MIRPVPKPRLFAAVAAAILVLDVITKRIAESVLRLHEHVDVFSDYVRFTLVYNRGAAFGLDLGPYSRGIFMALSLAALGVLAALWAATPAREQGRLTAISLIAAGALGNLFDRMRSARGVVDFIDVGMGSLRWPVFNVADIAVTSGAILLAITLWREDEVGRVQR